MKKIAYQKRINIKPFLSSDENEEKTYFYNLYGVLVHWGNSSNSGHYYSFIKASNGSWYRMDDSRVERTTEYEVLNQFAYILFYSREVEGTVNQNDNLYENTEIRSLQNTKKEKERTK